MKTLYVVIAMLFLFIIIPPDNKANLNCYDNFSSYQKKVTGILSDTKCLFKNLEMNINTRVQNFYYQSSQFVEITKELNPSSEDVKNNFIGNTTPVDLLQELNINKEDLNKISNQIDRQKLLNELNN